MKRLLLLLLALPSVLAAQAPTARDSAHVALALSDSLRLKVAPSLARYCKLSSAPAYMKLGACASYTRLAGKIRAADSVLVAYTPPVVTPPDTAPPVVVVPPDTTTPPVPNPQPPPTPLPAMVGPAKVAALPLAEPDVTYPAVSRSVKVCATCSLQAALTAAQSGDEILLAPGATYAGNFTWPNKGAAQSWVVLRTDVSLAVTGRMTPGAAASNNLAKIVTTNQLPALGTDPGAHHLWVAGVELAPQNVSADMNMIVRWGDVSTTHAAVPHHLVLDRVYLHGLPTLNVARCMTINSAQSAVLESWLGECHSNNKHSQAVLGYSGTDVVLIRGSYLEAGHEVVAFGGNDNQDDTYTPRDITIRGSTITRPLTWKGVWQVANLLETKNVRRLLVEGSVLENNWVNVQDGAAIVLKSENQTGNAPWSSTQDVTFRGNLIRCTAKAFRFSGHGSNSSATITSVTAARITVTGNTVTDLNVAPCNGGDGTPVHLLAGVTDVVFTHNTILNPGSGYGVLFEGGPFPTFAATYNILGRGGFGALRTGGVSEGTPSLTNQVTASLFTGNLLTGNWGYNGGNCSAYPTTTTCVATVPATVPMGSDSRPVGAP